MNRKIVAQKIIPAHSLYDLQVDSDPYFKNGWEPLGGVITHSSNGSTIFYQCYVKYETLSLEREVEKYEILTNFESVVLSKQVTDYLLKGWKLHGKLITETTSAGIRFFQCVIKYKE